ncbi:MAG TPA: hypothetical protein DIU14_08015, partial [Actinobacteria bacterium]|nr:hypothetical protein [Actinomycetota bacterium]
RGGRCRCATANESDRGRRDGEGGHAGVSEASPEEILRALADPERLALAGMLARGPRTMADL